MRTVVGFLALGFVVISAAAYGSERDISPLDLFFTGYRGELTDYGISKYYSFCWDWKTHRMSESSLAKAGVLAGLLSQESSENVGYLNKLAWSIEDTCGYN